MYKNLVALSLLSTLVGCSSIQKSDDIKCDPDQSLQVNMELMKEYMNEYRSNNFKSLFVKIDTTEKDCRRDLTCYKYNTKKYQFIETEITINVHKGIYTVNHTTDFLNNPLCVDKSHSFISGKYCYYFSPNFLNKIESRYSVILVVHENRILKIDDLKYEKQLSKVSECSVDSNKPKIPLDIILK